MNTQTLWKKILSELEIEVSSAVFNTMFKQTRLSDISDTVVTVSCISPVIARLIEARYYGLLKGMLNRHLGKDLSLVFAVDATLKKPNGQKNLPDAFPLFETNNAISVSLRRLGIRPDYTFENFAVSTTNQLAAAAASHVGKHPGNSYNPLFLYGGVGVGKTHLMHAVAHSVLQREPGAALVLCAGEEFTNEIIEAIRTKTTAAFRNKFRRAIMLCIDDIQFIAGKDAVQEEFFHTFNAVLKNGGQIILTSDKPPTEILKLEARLKSRLEGGLLVDIAPPDFELRVAIFLIKARAKGLDFPVSLAKIIATSISDTRGLEGFLTRVIGEIHMKNAVLSEELILKLLGGGAKGKNGMPTLQKSGLATKDVFIESVCTYFDIKPTHLRGKKRNKGVVLPRQILMYLLRTELFVPLSEIGDFIGGRDHTTVMHAVGKISRLVGANESVRGNVLGIKKIVYG